MELIHTLSDQLDARIDLEQGPGTVYVLEAHPQEKRRRA
jgi:two-component sensor histidine kinase